MNSTFLTWRAGKATRVSSLNARHYIGSWWRFCWLSVGVILAACALIPLLDYLTNFKAAAAASGSLVLSFLMWSQRRRIPTPLLAGLMGVWLFCSLALICNIGQIRRPQNVWQFLTFADDTPWTQGHTLGAFLGSAAFMLVWPIKFGPENSEEILSGPRLISMEEAQRRADKYLSPSEKNIIRWGGLTLPERCGTEHFAIVGAPGSGKSLTLQLLMQSVLPRMKVGSKCRALIYDAKRDSYSMLAGMYRKSAKSPQIHVLNPFESRSVAWDMSKDIRDGSTAHQVAGILLPKTGRESQPFFIDAARALLGGVIEAFVHISPERWTLRDVVLAMRHTDRMVTILEASRHTKYLASKYIIGGRRDKDIETTLENTLRGLSFVAAAWHHTTAPAVSLMDWVQGESILLLGADPAFDYVLGPLNRAIFKRVVELMRGMPDVPHGKTRQSWFIIDELRNAGNLEDLDKLLVEGRSKGACVAIGFQDISGLYEVFGRERANEILGTCANKIFLQNGEGNTIRYASDHFKGQEILQTHVSSSYSGLGLGPRDGFNISQHRIMRPVVHEGLLKSLPKPVASDVGVMGYCDTALVGTEFPYKMEVTWETLSGNLPKRDKKRKDFIRRPASDMELRDWTIEDLERLGLIHFQILIGDKSSTSPSAAGAPDSDSTSANNDIWNIREDEDE